MKNKHTIKLISMLLAMCILAGCCAFSAAADVTGSTLSYLALGDSISAGYGLDNPEEDGFTALLADALSETYSTEVTLTNEAVSGLTAANLYVLLETGMYDDVVAEADVITLTIGGNDMMAAFYEYLTAAYNTANGTDYTSAYIQLVLAYPSGDNAFIALALLNLATADGFADGLLSSDLFADALNEYAEDLAAIGSYIRGINTDAVIITATQYNPYRWLGSSNICVSVSDTFERGTDALNSVIRETAAGFSSAIAEVSQAFASSEENLCNAYVQGYSYNLDFHPNTAGHAVIAQAMLAAYESAVSTNETDDTPDVDTETDSTADTETDIETDSAADSDTDTEADVTADTDTEADITTDTDADSTEVTVLLGDVDDNGIVNSVDALYILRFSAGLVRADAKTAYIADVNKDSAVSSTDALAVLRYSAGLPAEGCAGAAENYIVTD